MANALLELKRAKNKIKLYRASRVVFYLHTYCPREDRFKLCVDLLNERGDFIT